MQALYISPSIIFTDSDDDMDSIPLVHKKEVDIPPEFRVAQKKKSQKKGPSSSESPVLPQYSIDMISTKTIRDNERKKLPPHDIPGAPGQFAPYRPPRQQTKAQKKKNGSGTKRKGPIVRYVPWDQKKLVIMKGPAQE